MATLLCLMYHDISVDPVRDKYSLAYGRFSQHMEMIRQYAVPCITTARLSPAEQKKYIMISFDDGWSGNWSLAAPLLQRLSLPATFFIATGFMDTSGYMTWKYIKELYAKGFDIQSHTHSHCLLSEVSKEKIKEELKVSKDIIEQKLGSSVRALSLPGGRGGRRVHDIARACGYDYIFTSIPGITRLEKDVRVFKRMLIKKDITSSAFKKILSGDPFYFAKERILYAAKSGIKCALGNNRYHELWRKYYKMNDK